MTRTEALAILESGNFDSFVGVPETLEVEFKDQPYQLDHDNQKFELAKDVSAFANAAGGVLVIGARTSRDDRAAVDTVSELRLLHRDLVATEQYEDTIAGRIYPTLGQLSVRFYPTAANSDRGLVAIDVPPQQEIDRYFLVQRPISEGDDRSPGWLVGIAVRGVGRVEVREVAEIHTLVNRGLNLSRQLADLAEGVADIREMVGAAGAIPLADTPADRLADVITARIAEIGR